MHSSAYQAIPESDPEAKKKSEETSMSSADIKADKEEYNCGWVYLNFEYTEIPPLNLLILQQMRGGMVRPAGVYFAVLTEGSLQLYEAEDQEACLAVTSVQGFLVDIWPHSLLLDEIYRKDYPLRLTNPTGAILGGESSSCFIYAASASEKEDWLIALRRASGGTPQSIQMARDQLDFPTFMKSFDDELSSQKLDGSGLLISALLQRIMFNVYKAEEIEQLIREKFIKRTETLPLPFFLGPPSLDSVDLGRAAPILGNGQLHSLSHHGELTGSLDIYYPGGLTMQLSLQVTVPVVVPIVVRIAVKRLAGRLMLRVKAPPSDRLWFGFYGMPDYDIVVEPVVSSISVTWGPVQRAISSRIDDFLREFLVMPNMEEIPLPPLLSGALFLGERPFELGSLPPVALQNIIDSTAYTAEGLSRRSTPVLPVVGAEDLPVEGRRTVESLIKTRSHTDLSSATNRKIFVALSERQLSSPLLTTLAQSQSQQPPRAPEEPRMPSPEEHPHAD